MRCSNKQAWLKNDQKLVNLASLFSDCDTNVASDFLRETCTYPQL